MYASSTLLLIKAGKVLDKEMAEYETLYRNIVKAFKETYMPDGKLLCQTQTARVVALHFNICEQPDEVAASLAPTIEKK